MKYHSMIPELTISDIEITKDFYLNNSDYLQKARKYGHFTGYKN